MQLKHCKLFMLCYLDRMLNYNFSARHNYLFKFNEEDLHESFNHFSTLFDHREATSSKVGRHHGGRQTNSGR